MNSAISVEEQRQIKERSAKPMLAFGIVGMVMFFAGISSAYIISREEASWITFDIPAEFIYSTVFILLSSVTMIFASRAIKKGNLNGLTIWSGVTMALGIMFVVFQLLGYQALLSQDIFFTGRDVSSSFSFLYLLTALHMVHLFAGIISLIVVFIKSILGRYSAENKLGVELAAIFWHFLDLLWIYLLLFLLFIR